LDSMLSFSATEPPSLFLLPCFVSRSPLLFGSFFERAGRAWRQQGACGSQNGWEGNDITSSGERYPVAVIGPFAEAFRPVRRVGLPLRRGHAAARHSVSWT